MTTVINIRDQKDTPDEVYIGRPRKFGNPISIGKTCPICGKIHDRSGTLDCYRVWLYEQVTHDPKFREAVKGLKGKTLVCYCKPLPCHGDILAEFADSL